MHEPLSITPREAFPERTASGLESALAALAEGLPVVCSLPEAASRTFGIVIVPALAASPHLVNFMVRHCRGIVSAALTEERCEALALVPQNPRNDAAGSMVTVEARDGITSGISAFDRSRTLRLLGDPDAVALDFVRPGHIVPLRARAALDGTGPGPAEIALELMRRADREPAAALCEVLAADGRLAGAAQLNAFATRFAVPLLARDELR